MPKTKSVLKFQASSCDSDLSEMDQSRIFGLMPLTRLSSVLMQVIREILYAQLFAIKMSQTETYPLLHPDNPLL
jgi:hypothetical protein